MMPAIDCIRCPLCFESGMASSGSGVSCPRGHNFNLARQGYHDFMTSNPHGRPEGDSLAMIEARESHLLSGAYQPIAAAVADILSSRISTGYTLFDAGAGTGYYAAEVAASLAGRGIQGRLILADASLYAVRRAARTHNGATVIRMDIWRPFPLATRSIDVCIVVFAPRNFSEMARILKPGSCLVVVTPAPEHMVELRQEFGLLSLQADKQQKLEEDARAYFSVHKSVAVNYQLKLDAEEVLAVIGMGPNARHFDAENMIQKLAVLDGKRRVTVDVEVDLFIPSI